MENFRKYFMYCKWGGSTWSVSEFTKDRFDSIGVTGHPERKWK